MSRKVWKALGVIGTIGILTCSCSKSTSEPVSQMRLHAEKIVATTEPEYTFLEEITLRDSKRIARVFFFRDGVIDANTAHYNSDGLIADLQLFENPDNSMKQYLFDEVKILEEAIADYDPKMENLKEEDNFCIAEITYTKERTVEEDANILIYRYPCSIIVAVFRQADGSYLLLEVSVDNEFSTGETGKLYEELLSAYGIMYENK